MTGCQLNGHSSIVSRYIKIFLFNISWIFFSCHRHWRNTFYCIPYSNLLLAGPCRNWIWVGERLSAPMHTSPGGQPTLLYGYRSFLVVKWKRCGHNNPPPSSAKVKESTAIPVLLCAFMALCRVTSTFLLYSTYHVPDYVVSWPEDHNVSLYCHENLKFYVTQTLPFNLTVLMHFL
jgi:hypothetical protein